MGRKLIPGKKVHIGCRVEPAVKRAIEKIASDGLWKPAQAVEILIKESPRLKAEMRKNGRDK